MRNLKLIIRSLLGQKLNTTVIVISLGVGFSCVILIATFIYRELSTDGFQKHYDRIFALKCDDPWRKGSKMYHCKYGSAEYMKKNYQQVEDLCRISGSNFQKIMIGKTEYFDGPVIIAASGNFFSFFSYRLLTGIAVTVLESNNDIVISDDLSRKYFGSVNSLGKVITIINKDKKEEMVVSGVFKKPAENTQIKFDMVRRIGDVDSRCYLRLSDWSDKAKLEGLLVKDRKSIPVIYDIDPEQFYLEPFRSTYFDQSRGAAFEAVRSVKDLSIALLIGLIILAIAAFNYLGLVNNQIIQKTREYNVQRVHGCTKALFIRNILIQNLFIIALSAVLSIELYQELIPFFNELTDSNLTFAGTMTPFQLFVYLILALFLLMITFLYSVVRIPAGVNTVALKPGKISGLKVVQVPLFNIFQLASSIILLVCSLVILKQMSFIKNKQIGIDRNVIEIKLPGQYASKATIFKQELLKDNHIKNVSIVGASPLLEHFLVLLKYTSEGTEKQYSPAGFSGDENFIGTLGIDLVRGPGFSDEPVSNQNKCLINQTLANMFRSEDLIGKSLPGMEKMIVAGVVKDFNYSSLRSDIEPAFISFDTRGSHLMVRPADNQNTLAREAIASVWKQNIPDYPLNIESVSERFEYLHHENTNYIRLIGACALISLFLSMIGLFAISYHNSRSRTKEIGIRKINGARSAEVLRLLSGQFVNWLLIATLFAIPVSWYFMHKWLQNFAYKTEITIWVFILAELLTVVIMLATVGLQSWRTATKNPVEALRYE